MITLGVWVGGALLSVSLNPQGQEPSLRLAWVREGFPPAIAQRVGDLPPGEGCLAVVVPDAAPTWRVMNLPRDAPRVGELVRGGAGTPVSGQVETADVSTYVPEVVLLPPPAMPPLCWQALSAVGFERWQVGRGGVFTVGPLPPGRWTLRLTAAFHEPQEVQVELAAGLPTLVLPPVTLSPRGRVVLDVRVSPSEGLTLLVEEVGREPGSPPRYLPGRQVALTAGQQPSLELPLGRYRLQLRDAQPLPLWIDTVEVAVGEQTLTIEPQTVEVEGVVISRKGGVEGVRLEVVAAPEVTVSVTTDATGAFALRLPKPDKYLVEMHLPDGRWQLKLLDLSDASPGERVRRELEVTDTWVRGRVVSREGRPLAGAEVVYKLSSLAQVREQFMSSLTADGEGRFFVPLSGRVSLELQVSHRGFLPTTLLWPADPPEEVVVTLQPGLEVAGRVTDAAGRPLAGARVAVPQGPFESPAATARADAEGRFTLTVPLGSILLAWGHGARLGWTPAQETVHLTLAPLGQPSLLTLVGADRTPLARARLAALTAEGVVIPAEVLAAVQGLHGSRGVTDPEGRVLLGTLADGTYTVLGQTSAKEVLRGVVVLPAQGEVRLEPVRPAR